MGLNCFPHLMRTIFYILTRAARARVFALPQRPGIVRQDNTWNANLIPGLGQTKEEVADAALRCLFDLFSIDCKPSEPSSARTWSRPPLALAQAVRSPRAVPVGPATAERAPRGKMSQFSWEQRQREVAAVVAKSKMEAMGRQNALDLLDNRPYY
ncbi:hypothetical protein B0H17DRAFT_1200576 [Mycena rosella]|uniref:Uncharacterized protein n=1 Tax=Mycena rosella TaxID=1033263 RepID=A0AAD7DI37_MYCRO|nr:hypothetical protein B0H17DRAFT_1200576 [Mycena rosella]